MTGKGQVAQMISCGLSIVSSGQILHVAQYDAWLPIIGRVKPWLLKMLIFSSQQNPQIE